MQIIYTQEAPPETFSKSIFLVGPTPREPSTKSWRPEMLAALERAGYDGVVFVPEFRDWKVVDDYQGQVEWEKMCLEMADVILAWVPRCLETMPAFTTNVEFGTWLDSGKIVYGRPDDSPKNDYLDWLYHDRLLGTPFNSIDAIVDHVVKRIGGGAERSHGERKIPIHIYKSQPFFRWWADQTVAGNRIVDATVRFQDAVNGKHFAHILGVKMWVAAEQRLKENEFVFSRLDTVAVAAFYFPYQDEAEVVLVREYRVPARGNGYVMELPGGSAPHGETSGELAANEFFEETGLRLSEDRFRLLDFRQMNGTLTSHSCDLYGVVLDVLEVEQLKAMKQPQGKAADTERTWVEVCPVSEIKEYATMDWANYGMIRAAMDYLKKK
jgi:8-oxo-dGTP pyrophosphatase MutT (NUDIX family)